MIATITMKIIISTAMILINKNDIRDIHQNYNYDNMINKYFKYLFI